MFNYYFKQKLLALVLFISGVSAVSIALPSAISFADVSLLVLDTPIDYQHSWISPFINTTAMSRYYFKDTDNREASWKDLNDFYMSDLKMSLNSSILPKLIELLDKRGNRKLTPEERRAADDELMQNVHSNPDWSHALAVIGHYLHGTHVAGLSVMGHDASQVKLITAPVFSKYTFEAFMNQRADRADRNIAEITRAISDQNIKVVNMSFGSPWRDSVEKTMESQLPLFLSNPDTVFVIAAGNSSTDISQLSEEGSRSQELFPQSKVKNVLLVAALDEKGNLAHFSDYGDGFVGIAAPGTSIGSSCPGDSIMHLDGTSMASPIVANRMAQVRLLHPELDAPEAIAYLLSHETEFNPRLVGKVTHARSLTMKTELASMIRVEHEAMMEMLQ